MKYYRLVSDGMGETRWWLDTPRAASGEEVDFWPLVDARRFTGHERLIVPVDKPGRQDDIVLGAFDIPYLSPAAAKLFDSACGKGVQLIEARTSTCKTIYILNILSVCACLDRERSKIQYASSGRIHMVTELKIEKDKVEGLNAFRIKDWMVPIIISDSVAAELGRTNMTGFSLLPV